MAVPDYQQSIQPMLQYLNDGEIRSQPERRDWLADYLQLSAEDRQGFLPEDHFPDA